MSNEEEKKIDETVENIYRGLERTVIDLQDKLPEQVDSMSVKQLRRALKAVILYPEVPDDLADNMSEREQKFSASMLALHQATVQLEIRQIGELQREYHNKQQQAKEAQGEK